MNKQEYEAKDRELLTRQWELKDQIRQVEGQRQKLKDEYYAANAIAVGQAVIYRWKPNGPFHVTPHALDGQLCHIYEVSEQYDGFRYSIRKAKKDGTPAQTGKSAWGVKEG